MSGDKAFFDTNVLLYMYGGTDTTKQRRAKELFHRYTRSDQMVISTQVIQEFYVAGSRKLGMPRRELREITTALLELPLVVINPGDITLAIQIEDRYNISFWDALIVSAAQSGGAKVLYTEDLNDGQQYGTVMARNPFLLPDLSSLPG